MIYAMIVFILSTYILYDAALFFMPHIVQHFVTIVRERCYINKAYLFTYLQIALSGYLIMVSRASYVTLKDRKLQQPAQSLTLKSL